MSIPLFVYLHCQPDHPRADVLNSFFHELIAEIAQYGQFTYNIRTLWPKAIVKNGDIDGNGDGGKVMEVVGEIATTIPEALIREVYHKVRFVLHLLLFE